MVPHPLLHHRISSKRSHIQRLVTASETRRHRPEQSRKNTPIIITPLATPQSFRDLPNRISIHMTQVLNTQHEPDDARITVFLGHRPCIVCRVYLLHGLSNH